jgi:transposase InsO family protein
MCQAVVAVHCGARPPVEVMVGFIDAHWDAHGVEPICSVLPIAQSTHHEHLAKRAHPARRSDPACRDEALHPKILRVFEENWRVYGARNIRQQLGREGFDVVRCKVAQLVERMGVQGVMVVGAFTSCSTVKAGASTSRKSIAATKGRRDRRTATQARRTGCSSGTTRPSDV